MRYQLLALLALVLSAMNPASAAGDLDSTFVPPAIATAIWDVLPLEDGSVIAVGQFPSSATIPAAGIVKLTSTGAVDSTFAATGGGPNGLGLCCIARQNDGKFIVGGRFTTFHGVARVGVVRLNADGSLDTSFNAGSGPNNAGPSWSLTVNAIAILPDGKIIAGGDFTTWSGSARPGLVRLNANGTLDTTFASMASSVTFPGGEWVKGLSLQPAATAPHYAILVAGAFYKASAGSLHSGVIRLKADGTKDTTFDPVYGAAAMSGGNSYHVVSCVVPQTDGKVLVGGRFTYFNNQTAAHLIRLNGDGSTDATFRTNMGSALTGTAYPEGHEIVIQPDGDFVVTGKFSAASGQARAMLARYHGDGTVDNSFTPPSASSAGGFALALQADGKLFAGAYGASPSTLNLRRLNTGLAAGAGSVQFASATASVTEGNAVTLTVNRTGGSLGAVSVNYQAASGTATNALDFPASSGTLTWADGETTAKTITINVPTDNMLEPNETFAVNLAVPVGATRIGAVSSATVTVADGDTGSGLPTVFFDPISSTATEGVGVTLDVTVKLSIAVGVPVTVPFTLGGTATLGATGDWTLAGTSPITFAAGETVKTLTVALVDNAVAEDDETAVITLGAPTGAVLNTAIGTHTLTIQDNETRPIFTQNPVSRLVAVGQAGVTFTASATGIPAPTVTWLYKGKTIAGTTNAPGIVLFTAALGSAGTYAAKAVNKHGTVTSSAELGVVSVVEKTYVVAVGSTATLPLTTAGNALAYAWRNGSGPLSGSHYTGLSTKTLVIKGLLQSDTGDYTCRVTNAGPDFKDVPLHLKAVENKPVFTTALIDLGTRLVSEPVNLDLKTLMNLGTNDSLYPASFKAVNLPAGLALNTITGVISGRPTKASPATGFAFTITATNPKGTCLAVPGKLIVNALPADIAGAYTCSVARQATLCKHGGRIDFNVATNGVASGKCILGTDTHSFTTGAITTNTATSTIVTASISIPRAGSTPLTFTFSYDSTVNYLTTGSLTDGTNPTPVTGWRNIWNPAPAITPYAGYYTMVFDPPALFDPLVPQGNGWVYFTVAANGAITLSSGKLGDSTSIALSGNIGPFGEIMIWQSLYAGKGHIQGMADILPGGLPGFTDSTVSGTAINWTREPTTDRVYGAGFTNVQLSALGARYIAPTGSQIAMLCADKDRNARLEFTEGGVPTGTFLTPPASPNVELRIKVGGTDLIQTVPNTRNTQITITPKSGTFTGTFTIADTNPATSNVESRPGTFTGIIIDQSGTLGGYGHFLLPELSNPSAMPSTTTLTSKKLSGQVLLIKQ